MKRILVLIPLLFLFQTAFSARGYDSLLNKLNTVLDKKNDYDADKIKRINGYKKQLNEDDSPNLNTRYAIYLKLYNEYKSFNYDEAFNYTQKLQQVGRLLKDPSKIAYGKIKLGFILLSSGMFKETFDSLRTVNVKLLADSEKKEYYFLTARTYYDLSDFDKDNYYTPIYNSRASKYIDSGVALSGTNSVEYKYYIGLQYLKAGNVNKAVTNLRSLINHDHLTFHQF